MKKYQVSQGIFQCNFNSPNLVKSTSTKDKCLTFMPQQSYISLLLQGPELFSFQLGTSNFPTGRVKVSTFLLEPDEQRSNLSSPISSMTASLSSCLDYTFSGSPALVHMFLSICLSLSHSLPHSSLPERHWDSQLQSFAEVGQASCRLPPAGGWLLLL